ncbi:MFS transporter [Pantoea sp. Tr-811]|uniref:NTP/NDP exchange transporter n=1 Tax=Pantoea sp. Tr-811 TaxID=2608361 RepID=UPI001420BB6F|nr:MFS transporter [Pantoea sp. Tr-811]NIF24758.1 MFS transporter [Pantoea sp. Tr-811]
MQTKDRGITPAQFLAGIKPEEASTVTWSLIYTGSLFFAYYVLRPIRDELGVASGVSSLPWLFTSALVAMIILNPMYGYLVRRFTRQQVISISYRCFSISLAGITAVLAVSSDAHNILAGRIFFIWVSVFNLFVVSVFWSFIQDIFDSEQGKRLFGILAAGSTIGGLLGSALTASLFENAGRTWLIIIAIILIEFAVLASRKASLASSKHLTVAQQQIAFTPIGGGVFSGIGRTFKSPHLLGLALFILLYSITSAFLYLQQASYADASLTTSTERTIFFANIELWVHATTLFFQIFLTGRFMAKMGVLVTLCSLPIVSTLGFAALATNPTVCVFIIAQVVRRVTNFALTRPAKEILFTGRTREDRYKAKTFIDTVIYRSGDQVGSWGYASLMCMGLGTGQIAAVGIPLSLAWLALSAWLGSRHIVETQDAPQP